MLRWCVCESKDSPNSKTREFVLDNCSKNPETGARQEQEREQCGGGGGVGCGGGGSGCVCVCVETVGDWGRD